MVYSKCCILIGWATHCLLVAKQVDLKVRFEKVSAEFLDVDNLFIFICFGLYLIKLDNSPSLSMGR